MEGYETTRRWEGDCRELVRFVLLIRRNFAEKMEIRFKSTTPGIGAVLQRRTNLRFV